MAEPEKTESQDETVQAEAALDPITELEVLRAQIESERAEMRDRLMRALADLENTRKRADKDRREAQMYGAAKLARDMVPVHDNLSRALEVVNAETRAAAAGLVEGVELTLRELLSVLGKHGVTRISPQPGDMFDPHQHEAMFEAPVPQFAAGQIIQVVSDGFMLHEQLLRPAKVGVSSFRAN